MVNVVDSSDNIADGPAPERQAIGRKRTQRTGNRRGTAESVANHRRTPLSRNTLPTSRAVLGGLLVSASALLLFLSWQSSTASPTSSYAVARHDLAVGTVLTAADLELVQMDLPPEVAQRAIGDLSILTSAIVLDPLAANELVQVSDVVSPGLAGPSGGYEISFELERNRAVSGRLLPNETVDVLATVGSGRDATTNRIVAGAIVAASTDAGTSLGSGIQVELTLIVTSQSDVLAVANAIDTASVRLVRTTRAPASEGANE